MLSTNPTSSIQKRREQHRRQQSLEVPILATPLPANPRRTRPAPQGHRRGLSLDQSLSALNSPTGFRPLLPQDQGPLNGSIRIHIDATNTGHPQPDQHTHVQETQQHRPAQPGYQAQDFQSHLQQQLNGNIGGSTTHIVAPTPMHPSQEQALQELQHHLEWYQQQFGHSPAPTMQSTNSFNLTQPMANDMSFNLVDAQTAQQQPVTRLVHTPVSHGHARTVPNTPQHHVQSWPSPPATDTKHVRSQSFQLDVAPMPVSFDAGQIGKITSSPYPMPQDSFSVTDEQGHTLYSSSIADASSPGHYSNAGPMPTLFEEPTGHFGGGSQHGFDDGLLLQTVASASDDFNSPNFMVGNPLGMSPRTAMLHSLGEDVNASIVNTGIPADEVDSYISEQDPRTKVWYCMFEEDNGKKCDKWFKRRENARSHVQNHLGDRQFQCNDCSKTFVRQHDMKRHAAIHKDDRPHICPCGAKFARHDALTRHRQRGMCAGTLPGFEKSEEDKPKRGRPKKERPEMGSRTSKAKKARQMHRDRDGGHYASSSSAMSERSFPVTPPDTGDFDADAFINMANVDVPMSHASSWRDTPPTSPVSASPTKTISPALLAEHSSPATYPAMTGASSPADGFNYDDCLFGTVSSHPGVGAQDSLFSDALSPEYGSCDNSSPFAGHEDLEMDMEMMKAAAADMAWMEGSSTRGMDGEGVMALALDRWLSTH